MEISIKERFKKAWDAFSKNDSYDYIPTSYEMGYSIRPDRVRLTRGNERSIVNSIFNRIALDVASVSINHVKLDENGRYHETLNSSLNNCLTLSSNIDQTSRALFQDIVLSMLDEGVVAIVPTFTSENPKYTESYSIYSLRVGKIKEWYPDKVKINLYNEVKGKKEDVICLKRTVAIVENPLYSVINDSNSTWQRLIRKLNILDAIDEQSGAGKLDLFIQVPYSIKNPAKKAYADERRAEIERQLRDGKYGVAYIDATERVTQLNRPLENNLMTQIEYLTSMLYGQLGISQTVLDGTADEKTMLNYITRTVEPIISAIVDEMKRKFLSSTAIAQGQSILFFKDPFKLVPVADIANIADTLTRNEIASSNEIRQIIGWKPSDDPKADELKNSNISQAKQEVPASTDAHNEEVDNNEEK